VPTRQQSPWGLLVLRHGLPGATAAAAGTREQSLWASGVLGPTFQAQVSSVVALQAQENKACRLVSSDTHGVVRILGPAYASTQVSLAFKGVGLWVV
jgi:hypothetical protein